MSCSGIKRGMDEICDYALKNLEVYQPWENYYRLRRKELQMVFHFFEIPKVDSMLELGCGIGFTSSLFSPYATTVIAADLPEPDIISHTRGMKEAARLSGALGIENIRLVGSSAVEIPVKSGKVDLVYSQYVLEHIPMQLRGEVVREIKRVLSEGGTIITLVPNFLDRIYNYPYYYIDLFIRLLLLLRKKLWVKVGRKKYKEEFNGDDGEGEQGREALTKKFRRLMLPPIHGSYQSHLEEITKQFPFVWERLFRENGLKIIKTFSVKHSPLSTGPAIRFYEKTAWITKIIGDKRPFKYLGDCYCIVARKAHESR